MFTSPKIKVIGKFKKERFYCEVCQYPLLTSEDFEKDSEYECCHVCNLLNLVEKNGKMVGDQKKQL